MIVTNLSQLGEIVKKLRKQQGLTQTDLAFAAQVGVRFIVELENGKETMQIGKVFKVCNILGLKIDIKD